MSAKRFRIAFSFAGETKREFVEPVANILARRFGRAAILYDRFHTAEFARSDLAFHLPELYEKQADLIVAVFCSDYEKKEWCGLEWNAIYGVLKAGNVSAVMLTRFDRVEAKGLHGLAGYADLDHLTPEAAANLIIERLALNERHDGEQCLHPLPMLGTAPLVQREREEAQISISYEQETELLKIFQLMPHVSVAVCSQMSFSNDVSIKFAGLLMKAGVNVGQCALGTSPLNQFPPGISVYRAEESATITATESIVRALAAIGLEGKMVPRPVWNDERGARFPLHVIFGHHALIRETPLIVTPKEVNHVKPKPSNLSSSLINPRVSYEETEQMIEVFEDAPKIKLHITSLNWKACEDGQEIMERAGWICEAFRKGGINVELSLWETLGSIPNGTSIWWVKNDSNNDMVDRIIRAIAIKGLHPVEVRRPVSAGDCEIELMIGRNPMRRP